MSDKAGKSRLEEAARRLQEEIDRDILRTYGPAALEHWRNPRNVGCLENPDGAARLQGTCGDTMEMFLRLDRGVITQCRFQTDGCGTTIICGSVATELACGRPVAEALGAVSQAGILKVLGGLPESDVHCAELAASTLRRALADVIARRGATWKRAYEKS
jgi:nitrogen fixation NifU-like protein